MTPRPDNGTPHNAALCPLQQHPRYAVALRAVGGRARHVDLWHAGGIAGQAQIVQRRFGPLTVNWLARGPVWTPGLDATTRRAALAGLHDRALWLANPDSPEEADALYHPLGYRALFTAPHVAELDLSQPPGARRAAQHGKWRNRLRRAETSDLQITGRPLDPGRDAALLALEHDQRRARRYAALPPAFASAWAGTHPDATRLYRARMGGRVVAFMLMLLHAPVASYHLGWTGPEGRAASAHHLILWHAANDLAEQGFVRLDLGGVDTHTTPGLARFKIGSGARIRPLGPAMIRLRA